MNTKLIMTLSAVCLAAAGVAFTFLPQEIMQYTQLQANHPLFFLIQVLGAMYFAFAMLNWMTRTALIGGIYNKPIALANFLHFFIAGMAIDKILLANSEQPLLLWISGIVYTLFAIAFGLIFFRNPAALKK
ncbi:hypothetical protein [Limnovirga soli]|uniref:Uncharacterized protein n=1 Tax=Limnovirga soli TaxID=2656915 RepID=A0A8J8FI17_9BACT|nr:hypothetical protein [Limnovirga soli]NNV57578.1 hypothetical protein [Limnovirga soli]